MGRRIATIALVLVGAVMVCGAGLVLVLIAMLSHIHFDLGRNTKRPKPIAVSQHACPYLHAVRTTGNAAALSSMSLMGGTGSTRLPVAFPNGYDAQLAKFDFSLRVAASHVPAPLRRKLNEVAANVEDGRRLLHTAPNRDAYSASFQSPLFGGASALADARDLVGLQCGFTLSDWAF